MSKHATVTAMKTWMGAGLAILLAACNREAPPSASTAPLKVSVITVQTQEVPITTELPGRITAFRTAEVRPQVSGIILKRLFVEGSEVRAAQQLYQIDPAPYRAGHDSAAAAEASARALVERYKPLAEANAVSKQDYDNAVAAHLQSQAAVELARINLVYTKVLSPISGRIGRTFITEGALVTANQAAALASVQQLDPVYVDVTQPSNALLRLRREAASGQLQQNEAGKTQVRLKLEDGTDYPQSGTLEFSEVTVDQGTGSVTLRALMPNRERLLLPGMFVREQIQEGVHHGTVLVPQQAVSHDQRGEPNVLVVGPNDIVELRTLQIGRTVGDQWVVSSGLKAGDRLIIEGLQFARPGTKVVAEEYRPQLNENGSTAAVAAPPLAPPQSGTE
jgi:membrane fusion protein (multidrug efflux system)